MPGARPGAVLVTHINLAGRAAVTADTTRDLDSGRDVVRLYLGDALVVTMDLDTADALGDALADVDDIVATPSWPRMDLPR